MDVDKWMIDFYHSDIESLTKTYISCHKRLSLFPISLTYEWLANVYRKEIERMRFAALPDSTPQWDGLWD